MSRFTVRLPSCLTQDELRRVAAPRGASGRGPIPGGNDDEQDGDLSVDDQEQEDGYAYDDDQQHDGERADFPPWDDGGRGGTHS
jgi:hypothetical protein